MTDLASLQNFLRTLLDTYVTDLIDFEMTAEKSSKLYHYTSQDGLIGILRNACLFASDVRFMNDHTERKYADQFFTKLAGEIPEFSEIYGHLLEDAPFQLQTSEYAACFSNNGDSLPQWKMYGGFNGYSIGWESSNLACLLMESAAMVRLLPCSYDPEFQYDWLSRSIREILQYSVSEELDDKQIAFLMVNLVWNAKSIFKHPSFSYENETRLIALELGADTVDMRDFKYSIRTGKNNPIPYIRVPVPTPSEIIIGPSAHPDRAKQAIDEMLIRGGFKDVNTRISSAPFVEF